MTNHYSVLTGLEKTAFRTILFSGPLLIEVLPESWMNITIGAVLTFLVNYAKNYHKEKVEDAISQG